MREKEIEREDERRQTDRQTDRERERERGRDIQTYRVRKREIDEGREKDEWLKQSDCCSLVPACGHQKAWIADQDPMPERSNLYHQFH